MSPLARYQNSKQFRKELESANPLHPLYLFLGEEEGEKDKVIGSIADRLFPGIDDRRGISSVFYMEEAGELAKAAEFAVSPSMFVSARMCVIRDADKITGGKAAAQLMRDLVENRDSGTTVIITAAESKPPAVLPKDILDLFKVVQFWRLFDQDIQHYVVNSIGKMGMEIEVAAVERLLDLTGRDIKKVDEALEMIRFSGESGIVTVDIVKNFVHDVRSTNIFDFLDRFFSGSPSALNELKKLLDAGTPDLLILTMIMKEAETMERYRNFLDRGMDPDEALKKAGVNPRAAEHFTRRVGKFDAKALTILFSEIARADSAIKSGGRSKFLLSHPLFDLTSAMILRKKTSSAR